MNPLPPLQHFSVLRMVVIVMKIVKPEYASDVMVYCFLLCSFITRKKGFIEKALNQERYQVQLSKTRIDYKLN